MSRIFVNFLALVGLCFCIAAIFMFNSQVLAERRTADAEILSVDVESYNHQDDDGRTVPAYRPKYEIRYQAEGSTFQLPVKSPHAFSNPGKAEARARHNPPGSHRPVYYLPKDPESFVLDPAQRRIGFALLVFSIGLTLVGGAALLRYLMQPLYW